MHSSLAVTLEELPLGLAAIDRFDGDGTHIVADEMAEVRVQGLHRVRVQDGKGNASEAVLELRCRRICVLRRSARANSIRNLR